MKLPGPDHPITIGAHPQRMRVVHQGQVVADSSHALCMREANYPPVYYFPRSDANMRLLQASAHKTFCPFKGEASYFDIRSGQQTIENAVWSYEAPYEAVEAIRDHLAFYASKVDLIEEVAD
jgi:uncharacterized protein (DUF427 family)